MKLIMLDIDGVLNSADYLRRTPGAFDRTDWVDMLDPAACDRLATLTARSGASLVISSTWRLDRTLDEMRELLGRRGVHADVLGMTPCTVRFLPKGTASARGHEIQAWLDAYGVATNIVILDDDSDMAHLKHRHVKTSWEYGLQDAHVEQALRLFEDP